MNTGFEPLFDRLIYIRHLCLGMFHFRWLKSLNICCFGLFLHFPPSKLKRFTVRPAIPVAEDPMKCWVSFYFTLDQRGEIVYSTDQKPSYQPTVSGKIESF